MPKPILRILAFLLIASLVADISPAYALSQQQSRVGGPQALFASEALFLPIVHAMRTLTIGSLVIRGEESGEAHRLFSPEDINHAIRVVRISHSQVNGDKIRGKDVFLVGVILIVALTHGILWVILMAPMIAAAIGSSGMSRREFLGRIVALASSKGLKLSPDALVDILTEAEEKWKPVEPSENDDLDRVVAKFRMGKKLWERAPIPEELRLAAFPDAIDSFIEGLR